MSFIEDEDKDSELLLSEPWNARDDFASFSTVQKVRAMGKRLLQSEVIHYYYLLMIILNGVALVWVRRCVAGLHIFLSAA